MTPERWERLKAAFHGALDRPASERHAWLARACGDDDTLLREATALLASHDTAAAFLEEPAHIDPADLDGIAEGTRLGPYRVLEEIGRGGMGIVYLAEDARLGRRVALKALPPVVAAHPELQQRLRREARAAATITHPAVATVYALEEIDGHLVIVSEYVAGETLRAWIDRGAIDPARARAMAIQIAGALVAAHDAGVVHRDLKPENVLVTATGDIKVVDFGIAHVEGPEASRLTRAGAMLGTPAYMAPEQLLGTSVDSRADIYAFGVLLSEMTTGRHPLSAVTAPPSAPTPFATIVARCLQPDPAARYTSARELMTALELHTAAAATIDGPQEKSARWWWEFHQGMAALVYWLMTIPAWSARGIIGGSLGRTLFIATLVSVIVAANLRFHLWFTSRFYPAELRWTRRRTQRWIRGADWGFVISLAASGLIVGDANPAVAILLISVAIGTTLAFLIMERVTTRAAFRNSPTR